MMAKKMAMLIVLMGFVTGCAGADIAASETASEYVVQVDTETPRPTMTATLPRPTCGRF